MGDTNTTLQEVHSFAVRVAHEFRAPTRAIEGFATALREDLAAGLYWLALNRAGDSAWDS